MNFTSHALAGRRSGNQVIDARVGGGSIKAAPVEFDIVVTAQRSAELAGIYRDFIRVDKQTQIPDIDSGIETRR